MKIGDYVRYRTLSKQIKIGKIINIFDMNIPTYNLDNDDITAERYIIKSSPNIIDLIEVKDIITTINLCGEVTKIDGDKIYTTCYDGEYCSIEDIKSIVTKEQIERMEYKIND